MFRGGRSSLSILYRSGRVGVVLSVIILRCDRVLCR